MTKYNPKYTTSKRKSFVGDTLDSLENDEEYVSVAERFLTSIGEDDTTVDDIYEYLRDEEWNLGSSAIRSFIDIPNFTDQQKKDYKYLRKRFENADMGGFSQYLNFAADAGVDLITDPLTLAAVIAAPFTGGGTLGARFGGQGLANATRLGLKKVGKGFKHDKPLLGVAKKEKLTVQEPTGEINWAATMRKTKDERSKALRQYYNNKVKNVALVGAAEGAVWTGLDEYLRQERDSIDGIDFRDGLNLYEIGGTAALGTLLGAGFGASVVKTGQRLSPEVQRTLMKFSDEGIVDESDIAFKASKAKDAIISKTVGKPTTRFLTLSKSSKTLQQLLEKFRYDVYKFQPTEYELDAEGKFKLDKDGNKILKKDPQIKSGAALLGVSYQETYNNYNGKFIQLYEDVLRPLTTRGKLSRENEQVLTKLMRSKEDDYATKVPEATETQLKVVRDLKKLSDAAIAEGNRLGIYKRPLNRGPNDWFPRHWKWSVVKERRKELADIMVKSKAVALNDEVILSLLTDPRQQSEYARLMQVTTRFENMQENLSSLDVGEVDSFIQQIKDTFNVPVIIDEDLPMVLPTPGGRVDATRLKLNSVMYAVNQMKKNIADDLPESPELRKERYRVSNEVIDEMLSKKEQVNTLDIEALGTIAPSSFSPRKLFLLDDFDIEDFIDDDFDTLMRDYFTQTSRLYSRKKVLGSNLQEFNENYVKNIEEELKENGITLTNNDKDQLANLYNYTTGLADNTTYLQNSSDYLKISQQLAHLPLATLSSLTEILIPLTRVKASTYAKGMASTIKNVTSKIGDDTLRELQDRHGLSKEEAMREMHRVFLGLDQAIAQRIDSLAGEGVQGVIAKKIQRGFFKANLLSQWTRTVQLASFTMGKDLITGHLKRLNEIQIDSKEAKRITQELLDLGIDIDRGKKWAAKGAKIYQDAPDGAVRSWDTFYENQVMQGAARFTNEVILDPSKASSIRPHVQQTAAGSILFQFLGYPTAFSNTVLKNFYGQAARNPVRGGAKIASTALLMTGFAALTNYVRNGFKFTNPDGSDQTESEIATEAIQRWGGFGYGEYLYNAKENAGIGGGFIGSTAKAITGPAVGDVVDSILYRKGPGELITTNLPGYSLYRAFSGIDSDDRNLKQSIKNFGQDIDRAVGLRPEKKDSSLRAQYSRVLKDYKKERLGFTEGGEVSEDVPKASDNPSERIDRMTGQSYIDQANRETFVKGGKVLIDYFKKAGQYLIDDVLNIDEDEKLIREKLFIEESKVKDPVYVIENDSNSFGTYVDINPTDKMSLAKEGNLRTLNPYKINRTLNPNKHFTQLLNDKEFVKSIRDPELKKTFISLQKEYERMLGIPGADMYRASDENSKMAADFYSNAVLSKQLMEAFQRAGYDSIEFNVAREPVNPQERATKITETIEKETVPLVPSAEQKSMFNRTQEIEELKKAAEEQNRELDQELIDLQIKGLFPEDYMETDVPTKVMSFKGANTPLLSRELKDSSTRYFLLDDTQFLEKNKYTNFSDERLKEINEEFTQEDKIEFFKSVEDNIIKVNTPQSTLQREIEKGSYNVVTTATEVDGKIYGGRILTIQKVTPESLDAVEAQINRQEQITPDLVESEPTFEEQISKNVETLTAMTREAGWEVLGGKGVVSPEGESLGRTPWVPRSEWWREAQSEGKLPNNNEGLATRNAVAKAIAGDKLSAAETRHIEVMLATIKDWNEQDPRDLESFGITELNQEQQALLNSYRQQYNASIRDDIDPQQQLPLDLYMVVETIPGMSYRQLNSDVKNLLDINQASNFLANRQITFGQELLYHPLDNNVNTLEAKLFAALDTSKFNPRRIPTDTAQRIKAKYETASKVPYKFLTNAEIKKLYGFDTKPAEEDLSEGVDSMNVAGQRGIQDERNFDEIVTFLPQRKEEADSEIKFIVVKAGEPNSDINVTKGQLYKAEYNTNTGDIGYILDNGKAVPHKFKTETILRNLKVDKDYSKLQPDTDTVNVIVAGGRDFENYNLIESELDKLFGDNQDVTVISGKALGADTLGEQYATSKGFKIDEYPANWKKYGKRAGMVRNKQMADNANMLVAFWDGKSKGTGNMIKEARKKKLKVKVVRTDKQ